MKIQICRLMLFGLLLLSGLSGCFILPDATVRDARKAIEIPQACIDGARRDLQNYERGDRRAKP